MEAQVQEQYPSMSPQGPDGAGGGAVPTPQEAARGLSPARQQLRWVAGGLVAMALLAALALGFGRSPAAWAALWLAFGLLGLFGLSGLWRLERALRRAEAAHRAVARSEVQLRALVDTLPDTVVRLDRSMRHHYANAAVRVATGLAPEQFIGRSPADLGMPEPLVSTWGQLASRVFESGQPERLQFDFPGPQGLRTWESLVVPEPQRDGREPTLLVISRDITERRRLLDALRSSERRLAYLLDHTPAVIYSARPQGSFGATFYSANIEPLLGYRPQDFLADPEFWLQHVHPDDLPAVRDALARIGESRGPMVIEYRFRHRDGRWRWLRDDFRLVRDEGGEAELVGSCIDVTEHRQADAEVRRLAAELEQRVAERTAQLAASEQRFRRIFETVPVAIHEQDWREACRLLRGLRAQGVTDAAAHFARHPEFVRECLRAVRVLKLNGKAAELRSALGRDPQPGTLEAVFDTPEGTRDFVDELLALWQGQRLYTAQRRLALTDGRTLNLLLSMALPSLDGEDDGTVLVCGIDITEVDRLNAELDATVARVRRVNRELETFTYSVSHDLKAPLRGIDGYGRLLMRDHAHQLDEEGRAFLGHIRQATQHMGQLIDDLLAYSRLERRSLALGDVPLAPLVRAVLATLEDTVQQRGAVVELAVAVGLCARADAQGLEMALRNLLDNALKFGRPGVPLRIQVGAEPAPGGAVALWVRDNGVGFDMRFHDRIFEIFQRLHRAEDYPGTGVGLAIVRKAMERMGGSASAQAWPGEGAVFRLELPGQQ